MKKTKRNRTMTLSQEEKRFFATKLLKLKKPTSVDSIRNKVINQDIFEAANYLPSGFIDLLFVDPPYNLTKKFNAVSFKKMSIKNYMEWMDLWIKKVKRILKSDSSIYICGDWRSSPAIYLLCKKYFTVRNRITFEREKGRGAKMNWKNNSEDIWFCTSSKNYYFNTDAVKLKRKVIAPYKKNGNPKDWKNEENGKFRLTHPSNLWTDITIPFWSMRENTPHPTQKPEKLLAKIILASSKKNDIVFDPFAGAGTTGVVAKKLERNFLMLEIDKNYCLYALKRLKKAETNSAIQGYSDGVFWERNTLKNITRR